MTVELITLCFVQCTTTRSSTGTLNPPTCCWGTTATSKSQTSVWATSSRGRTLSCPARQGRRPSWPQRWWPSTSRASVEKWETKLESGQWSPYVSNVTHHIRLCLIVRNYEEIMSNRLLLDNHCVCLPGVRRVGDGSHTVLLRLWECKLVHSKKKST